VGQHCSLVEDKEEPFGLYLPAGDYVAVTDSPWSTPWLFIKKKDGSLRPIQDYQEVNKWTIHNVYPIPHIEQIMEQLKDKKLFTKFNVWSGYHNIQIREED
jgi:hypothetical protein